MDKVSLLVCVCRYSSQNFRLGIGAMCCLFLPPIPLPLKPRNNPPHLFLKDQRSSCHLIIRALVFVHSTRIDSLNSASVPTPELSGFQVIQIHDITYRPFDSSASFPGP